MRIDGRLLRDDEPFIPSVKMLPGIILSWEYAGSRFYGSGASGKYRLRAMERMAEATGSLVDTQVSIDRDLVDRFPEQALFRDGSPAADLFAANHRKWAKLDAKTLVESEFRDLSVSNLQQSAGRTSGATKSTRSTASPYSGKVWCARHGVDEDGHPLRTHVMTVQGADDMWICRSDYMRADGAPLCAKWQNRLSAILDCHLARALSARLSSVDRVVEESDQTCDALAARRAALVEDARALERKLRTRQTALEDMIEAGAAKEERQRYAAEEIVPLTSAIRAKVDEGDRIGRDMDRIRAEGRSADIETSLREVPARAVQGLGDMPVAERQAIVSTYLGGVDLLVVGGGANRTVVIRFEWRNGWSDTLVSFRGPGADTRPLTADEASVIQEMWPQNDVAFSDWLGRLAPGRRFAWVQRQAQRLGVSARCRKPAAWIKCAFATTPRCWVDEHPDVLYLQLSSKGEDRCLPVYTDGSHGEVIATPDEVLRALQSQQTILLSPSW